MTTRLASPVFVGRAEELGALRGALRLADAGQPTTVLLGGEAGVGKTRLADEFAAHSGAAGALVLRGACVELGGEGLPFAPVVGALRGLARAIGVDALADLAAGEAAELARLLPELGPAPERSEAGVGRLHDAVLLLIERLAAEQTVVLLLEDLHWADAATRDLVGYLVRAATRMRLLLLATFRSDELHRGHPLRPFLAELDRHPDVQRVQLERFTRDEVAAQLAGILGATPPPMKVEQIHRRTDGNAFFVEELVGCPSGECLPDTLRDVLLTRVDGLGEAAQRVARVAAAGGSHVSHRLLAAVAGLPEPALLDALREAAAANVLVADDTDGYTFRHALVREAVHDELLPGERTALHTAFADALEADPSLVGSARRADLEIARHRYLAHDAVRGLPAALRAADQAAAVYAYADQHRMLERALELWDNVPDAPAVAGVSRAGVLDLAIVAASEAGNHDRAVSLVGAALAEVDDPERRAVLLTRRGMLLRSLGRPGSVETLQEALALLPVEPPSQVRADALARLAATLMLDQQLEPSREVCEEALVVARRLGNQVLEADVLVTYGIDLVLLGEIERGLETMREAHRLAHELAQSPAATTRSYLAHTPLLLRAHANLGDTLHHLGRYEEAICNDRETVELATRLGYARTHAAFAAGNLAWVLLDTGEWAEAEQVVAATLQVDPPGVFALQLHAVAATVALRRGDLARAAHHRAEGYAAMTRRAAGPQYVLPLAILDAEIALAEGDRAAALDAVRGRLGGLDGPLGRYGWPLLELGVLAATEPEDRALLRAAADGLLAVTPASRAYAATLAARLAEADGAPSADAWAAAVEAWRTAGEPHGLGCALLGAAAATAGTGDRAAAAALLEEAAGIAERLGAEPLAGRAAVLARRLGVGLAAVPAPRAQVETLAQLTPREQEVLRLVASGRSNRQIADELFISAKTASVHVSNILAKLGVGGRTEAAAVAHRLHLVE